MNLIFSFSVFVAGPGRRRSMTAVAMEIFEQHQGTHILQVCFLYFSLGIQFNVEFKWVTHWSFPILHIVGIVGIFVLPKSGNKFDTVTCINRIHFIQYTMTNFVLY